MGVDNAEFAAPEPAKNSLTPFFVSNKKPSIPLLAFDEHITVRLVDHKAQRFDTFALQLLAASTIARTLLF